MSRIHYPSTPKTNGDSNADNAKILLNAFQMIHVVNLKEREDRWSNFRDRLQSRVVNCPEFVKKVERFDAVNGRLVLGEIGVGGGSDDTHDDGGVSDNSNDNSNIEQHVPNHLYNPDDIPPLHWDATNNAKHDRHIQPPMNKQLSPGEVGCAMSHIQLWRMAVKQLEKPTDAILILEDDAVLYPSRTPRQSSSPDNWRTPSKTPRKKQSPDNWRGQGTPWRRTPSRRNSFEKTFEECFVQAWEELPSDWDIWYLGFSDRGERIRVEIAAGDNDSHLQWFRPTYGFHTHAYALTKRAAERLLTNLPVVGPLDVWLADNQWFDLHVYCCVVENEGYQGNGAYLVTQDRNPDTMTSSIPMSARKKKVNDNDDEDEDGNAESPRDNKSDTPEKYVTPHRRPQTERKSKDNNNDTAGNTGITKSDTKGPYRPPQRRPQTERKSKDNNYGNSNTGSTRITKSDTKGPYLPPHMRDPHRRQLFDGRDRAPQSARKCRDKDNDNSNGNTKSRRDTESDNKGKIYVPQLRKVQTLRK